MGEKVQMDDHGWVDRVLPWFVNNTLDVGEQERVRRHLGTLRRVPRLPYLCCRLCSLLCVRPPRLR